MPDAHFPYDAALQKATLNRQAHYAEPLVRGTLRLAIYAPVGSDPQLPHEQDEVYIVAAGSGTFVVDGERFPFTTGDALFVPAGVDHRFEDFSDDFVTWVVFYGPQGGEEA